LTEIVLSPEGTAVFPADAPTDAAYAIRFSAEVTSAGSYDLFARVAVTGPDGDSFWVRVNGGAWIRWEKIGYPNYPAGWSWQLVGEATGDDPSIPVTFFLDAGSNTVEFVYREPGLRLDKVLLAQNTPTPTALGAAAVNCGTTAARDRALAAIGRLYPNPALDQVLLTDLPEPVRELRLTDVWGRTLRRFADTAHRSRTIDVAHLPPGIYWLSGQVGGQHQIWRFAKK
jgi:hypothetical protein